MAAAKARGASAVWSGNKRIASRSGCGAGRAGNGSVHGARQVFHGGAGQSPSAAWWRRWGADLGTMGRHHGGGVMGSRCAVGRGTGFEEDEPTSIEDAILEY